MHNPKFFLLLIALSLTSCSNCNNTIQATHSANTAQIEPFRISSSVFANGNNIPSLYTCDSTNISPPLHWNNPFTNTASFAIIMDDPDVPTQAWVHWIVYNIPQTDTSLDINFPRDSAFASGIKQGFTSFQITGYRGPCPPEGMHHYNFKLYALDTKLNVPARLTKPELLTAMKGHILAEADLTGTYIRKKSNQ